MLAQIEQDSQMAHGMSCYDNSQDPNGNYDDDNSSHMQARQTVAEEHECELPTGEECKQWAEAPPKKRRRHACESGWLSWAVSFWAEI